MKKFILHVLLFSLPPLAVCAAILFTEPDRKEMWLSSRGDCDNRGAFIYQRIFEDTTPVDMAFLGTSRTINGVMDTLIEKWSHYWIRQNYRVVNLGYCRFGNEMQYIIAKDLFANKHPEVVIIEVNQKIGQSSHPMYPYYAGNAELLYPASYMNQGVAGNVYNGFLARLSDFRKSIFNVVPDSVTHLPSFGYRGYSGVADSTTLLPPEEISTASSGNAESTWSSAYSKAWIEATVELCRANNARVFFLYIPGYRDQPAPTEGMDFYQSLAPVLIVSPEDIHDKTMWRENDHFNDKGAEKFSDWLHERLLWD